jgi:hypothetical protein
MAGMVDKKSKGSTKSSKGTTQKGGGASGATASQVNPKGGSATVITFTWTPLSSEPQGMTINFSQPVVWNETLAVNWRAGGATTSFKVTAITEITPTQWQVFWTGNVNSLNTSVQVPQNDATFKGQQGQFVNPGSWLQGSTP